MCNNATMTKQVRTQTRIKMRTRTQGKSNKNWKENTFSTGRKSTQLKQNLGSWKGRGLPVSNELLVRIGSGVLNEKLKDSVTMGGV